MESKAGNISTLIVGVSTPRRLSDNGDSWVVLGLLEVFMVVAARLSQLNMELKVVVSAGVLITLAAVDIYRESIQSCRL